MEFFSSLVQIASVVVILIASAFRCMFSFDGYHLPSFLLLGFLFHVIFIRSVFDCYFTSPVVHGMQSFAGKAQSKRLVLIVGDGLRADLLFQKNGFPLLSGGPETVAPFLRDVALRRGAFGVSHTRVPTESRPGHVAIIGGLYEDPSAVTKGWKANPVDFDSVFNRSSTTFSFGSPDILPMFARGATPGTVKAWSYNEEDEDFTKDATQLDIWVLEQLKTLLRNATVDHRLNSQLRSDKVVFFLHLLGLDTTGHSYRPHSREYMENIRVVDNIVKDVEALMVDFYGDQDTSFIFTADHGMSAIGSHGDGDPTNTRTPLIAWGKGIRGPLPDSKPSSHDDYSIPWELTHLLRRDVEQADVAPLMAALLGIDWPVNSVGVLPDVDPRYPGYIQLGDGGKSAAENAYINTKVILEQYKVKHNLKRQSILLYAPFKPLETISEGGETERARQLGKLEDNIQAGEYDAARQTAFDLIQTGLQGVRYLDTYQRTLIRGFALAAYTGWIAYAALFVFRPLQYWSSGRKQASPLATAAFILLLISFWAKFFIEKDPWTYYLYVAFPVFFWHEFISQMYRSSAFSQLRITSTSTLRGGIGTGFVVFSLLAMVAGYTHREVWSVGFFMIGWLWPMSWNIETRPQLGSLSYVWKFLTLANMVFPLLGTEKDESLALIQGGGAMMLAIGVATTFAVARSDNLPYSQRRSMVLLSVFQTLLIGITMFVTRISVISLREKQGLWYPAQITGWAVLVLASITPFVAPITHRDKYLKLMMYFLGLSPVFVLLSISIEGIFYVTYSATLLTWIFVEKAAARNLSRNSTHYYFHPDDARVVLFFLFFIQAGFFGTGNVASISSFYLKPVYRLIPVFDPFAMATLLIFKILVPYIILAMAFAALNHELNLPPFSLFLVALMFTDVLTLTFFFKVRDSGSWLEIGSTISFFCITSGLSLFSGMVCVAGEYLMSDVFSKSRRIHIE